MLCQKCNKNEADRFYMGNWNGTLFIAGFCSECVDEVGNQAASSGYGETFRRVTGWRPGMPVPRQNEVISFPEQASNELLERVRLNSLKYRLKDAVLREDYKEAARLRDSMSQLEQEEGCHES